MTGLSPGKPSQSSVDAMEATAVPRVTPMPDPAGGIDPAGLIATLFQAEAARLTSLARFFVDDRTAAEDLVQEAFIRLSRSLDRIRDAERATAYLRSIVINLARDHNRRGLMSFRHRPPAQPDEPSAEATAADLESRAEVIAALRRLPLRQRDCLVLRYYLDLGIDEIAATLQISRNSVKTHLQRGLRTMESSLEARQ